MANIYDDINTISTAVYGKEMRPAIVAALTKSKALNDVLSLEANNLRERIDALAQGAGGGETPDNPGGGGTPTTSGCNVSGEIYLSIDASISYYSVSGEAIEV